MSGLPAASAWPPSYDDAPAAATRKLLTKEQWEELKPFIHRAYFIENQSFKKVAVLLRDTYGFTPTFQARIEKWGFRKNESRNAPKRLLAVENQESSEPHQRDQSNQSPATEAYVVERPERGSDFGLSATTQSLSSTADPPERPTSPTETPSSMNSFSDKGSDHGSHHQESILERMAETSVDVPGSPKLSRLFTLLDRHGDSDTKTIVYESLAATDDVIDISDVQELSHRESGSRIDGLTSRYMVSNSSKRITRRRHPLRGRSVFKFSDTDAFFPSGQWLEPSPYIEMYPFPPTGQRRFPSAARSSELSASSLSARANRLKTFLSTFEASFSENHHLVIQSMQDLASTYAELTDYTSSAELWQRVERLRESTEGSGSANRILSAIELWKVKQQLDHSLEYRDTKVIEREVENAVLQYLAPSDDVAVEFYIHKAGTLIALYRPQEAELILRRTLQIRLTHLGPHDPKTALVIGKLGHAIALQVYLAREAGAEHSGLESCLHLARSAVQLQSQSIDMLDKSGQLLVTNLLAVLRITQQYPEACKFGESVIAKCNVVLGLRHPKTLRYLAELGASYRAQGRLHESVDRLQTVIKLQKSDGPSAFESLWRWQELGLALRSLDRYEEAAKYLEKVFVTALPFVGTLDVEVKLACWQLGECHIRLKQYDRALEVFTGYLEKVREKGGQDHPFVGEIEGWLRDNVHDETVTQSSDIQRLD